MKLVPITMDEIRNAGVYRGEAIKIYHEWIKAERTSDKKQLRSLMAKVYHFRRKLKDQQGIKNAK